MQASRVVRIGESKRHDDQIVAFEVNDVPRELVRTGDNKAKAARLLGLTRAQLRSRIEKHGLVPKT